MLDIEAQVYTPIADKIRAEFPTADVSGAYVNAPSQFPHVSIVEADNYITTAHMDNSERERFATLMYEVNVYSAKSTAKKAECKAIMNVIDEMMYKLNFTRLSLAPIPNMDNASIYRMVARYRAETDGTYIYRR